jgi:hypothetical protein
MAVQVKYARVKYATALAPGLLVMSLAMNCAHAQQAAQPGPKRDDLDVTMQIIVDPDAKLPDEVVRRIPLPGRKPADQSASQSATQSNDGGAGDKSTKDTAAESNERAREAKELGRELGQSAKEKAQEAAEQREQARRSEAEDRRRDPPEPPGPPNPPGRPPRQ